MCSIVFSNIFTLPWTSVVRIIDYLTREGFRKSKTKEEKAVQIDFTYVILCAI